MEKIAIRRATDVELNFMYTLPEYIENESGKIGVFVAYLEAEDCSLLSKFTNFRADLKTEAFKNAFDELIDILTYDTRYGNLLANRVRLAEYCWTKLRRMSGTAETERYAARVDMYNYSFLFCFVPGSSTKHNVVCHCYVRELLDKYIKVFEDTHG